MGKRIRVLCTVLVSMAGWALPSMGIDTDGDGLSDYEETADKVVVWGDASAPTNIPANVIAPVAVVAGGEHALALLYDGSVKAWGDNTAGQCNVPELQTNAVAIAAGAECSLALLSNGSVVQWGWGATNMNFSATAVAAGDYHSLAILTNGIVTAWGTNDLGQCNVPASVTNAISISANRRFSSAVLEDGSVVVWGGGVGNDE